MLLPGAECCAVSIIHFCAVLATLSSPVRGYGGRHTPTHRKGKHMNEMQQKQAAKIAALLAKAESTEHQAERDALIEKATALQFQYSIDEAMLSAAGKATTDTINSIKLCEERNTPLIKAKRELACGLAFLNSSRPFIGYKRAYIQVIGFESDLRFIQAMYTSLLLQMQTEMARDEKDVPSWENVKAWRVSYAHAYVRRVINRMHAAQQVAKKVAEDSVPGSSLVLVSKAAQVDHYVGPTRKGKSIPNNAGKSLSGADSGRRAADRADIGQRGVSGSRAAISG